MRILVTGVTGFAGSHLAEALLARGGVELFGLSRGRPEGARAVGALDLRTCDPTSVPAVEAVLRDVRPEQIYHLAGYAHAGRSFQEVDAAWIGNLTVTRCLYEAVQRWGGKPRILFVGSGLIYGDAPTSGMQDENTLLYPSSPYSASKAAADLVSYQVTRHPGLDVVRARPFNHIGPRQSPQYALPNFARQIVAIERGQAAPVLETGNLGAQRDLTDVRDVVSAYLLLMERGRTGEAYNIASGRSQSMQVVLERLLALAGLRVEVRSRADLMRGNDPSVPRIDTGRLRRETGWAPRFSLDQSLADILAHWRQQGS
jgi:GDP-4-dehydro-6-deoxy-D-mannose reductase